MGMYDDVRLFMACPKCGESSIWGLQTKDLESCLYQYQPLDEDWFTRKDDGISGKAFRSGLPVFPTVPYDKEPTCWANQAERHEILAKPSEVIANQLKYIEVHGSCPQCETFIRGKLNISNGYLTKPVFDMELS
ncbi:MAG: hypothetical protein KAW83_05285 [Dehalococcoidia bacterium]|nr:hypothetical protein [Dehalococcoidia bacterium]